MSNDRGANIVALSLDESIAFDPVLSVDSADPFWETLSISKHSSDSETKIWDSLSEYNDYGHKMCESLLRHWMRGDCGIPGGLWNQELHCSSHVYKQFSKL